MGIQEKMGAAWVPISKLTGNRVTYLLRFRVIKCFSRKSQFEETLRYKDSYVTPFDCVVFTLCTYSCMLRNICKDFR